MTNGTSLINFGELSKPATVLIEKISDAVGGIFKPWQMERVANAEANAEMIRTISELERQEVVKRALTRFVQEETIKQQNMESIVAKAIPDLSENADPNQMEKDWLMNFFDKGKLIADEEMQIIWSKILAGEANTPGSFSRRTVNLLAGFSKKDAELFSELCKFVCTINEVDQVLIFNYRDEIYRNANIKFSTLIHLNEVGVITFDALQAFVHTKLPKKILVTYHEEKVEVEFINETDNKIDVGCALLSEMGRELKIVCKIFPQTGFLNYVQTQWKVRNNSINIKPINE